MRIHPEYMPTPYQIAAACSLIRQGWSTAERERRIVRPELRTRQNSWQPPHISTSIFRSCLRRALSDSQ